MLEAATAKRPRRRLTRRRLRALIRLHGPSSPIFRRRLAIMLGAITVGVVAILFAEVADAAGELSLDLFREHRWLPLILTPTGFVMIVWVTRRYAPLARGSGIPQVIAARSNPQGTSGALVSIQTAVLKTVLTIAALFCGASTGREGPTVQLSAAVMAWWHRLFRLPMKATIFVAGGAAGVAAAFNTPLAGVAFAIEELAAAYEQRMTLLVMTAILISGMVAQGLAGDYVYFGLIDGSLPIASAMVVAPVAGLFGGITGGLFSRIVLAAARGTARPLLWMREHPLWTAGGCGAIVAALGMTTGLTWGTGYAPARAMILGVDAPLWFGFAKFAATAATAIAGLPGGIFAPSLSAGAGFGNLLHGLFPNEPASAVVLLGMVAYFTGVVRAPLTAVVIISETTGNRELMLPLLAAALIADMASQLVCRDKLYNALAQGFTTKAEKRAS